MQAKLRPSQTWPKSASAAFLEFAAQDSEDRNIPPQCGQFAEAHSCASEPVCQHAGRASKSNCSERRKRGAGNRGNVSTRPLELKERNGRARRNGSATGARPSLDKSTEGPTIESVQPG